MLDLAVANAVGPAIADVADPGAFGAEHQRRRRGSHAHELGILLALGMNGGVGFDECLAQGRHADLGNVFLISVRDNAHGQFARQLADGMRTHAVRYQEYVAALLPLSFVGSQMRGMCVLIMARAARPRRSDLQIQSCRNRSPAFTRPDASLIHESCYNAATTLPSDTSQLPKTIYDSVPA